MEVIVRHWLRIGLAAIVMLPLTLALTAPPLAAAPSVEVIPQVTPGTFRFVARDFEDDEEVSSWLTGPSDQVQESGIYQTDSRGDVSFTLRMPRHFEPGRWAITIHGFNSGLEVIGYFWMPDLGPNTPLTVTPEEGPRGTTFVFRGTGFDAFEPVDFWPTGPDGTAYEGGQAGARSDGSVEFQFVFGQETGTGPWAMSAYGMNSGRLGVVHFTLS
jgi:hypothetical protein